MYQGNKIHNAGNAYLAAAAGATAGVLLRGAGAVWSNGGSVAVGGSGTALLKLEAGGELAATGGMSIAPLSEVRGVGTLTAAVANGGVVAPGNVVGDLSVVGAFTQSEGAN